MLQTDGDLRILSWHNFDITVATSVDHAEVINLATEAALPGELEPSGVDV